MKFRQGAADWSNPLAFEPNRRLGFRCTKRLRGRHREAGVVAEADLALCGFEDQAMRLVHKQTDSRDDSSFTFNVCGGPFGLHLLRVMPRRSTTQAGSESSGSLHGLELIVRTAGERSGEVLHGERFSIVLVNDGLAVKREVYGHLVKHETGARVVRVLS